MPIKTKGINHPALFGRKLDETIQFYTEILGMRLVLRQPNLREPRLTHLFFSAGNGTFIAFFIPNEDAYNIEDEHVRKAMAELGFPQIN